MLALFGQDLPPVLLEEHSSSDSDDDEGPRQCMSHEAMTKLNEMRVNNQLCDAAILTDQGDVFNVHRAIMCACSDYFRFATIFIKPSWHFKIFKIFQFPEHFSRRRWTKTNKKLSSSACRHQPWKWSLNLRIFVTSAASTKKMSLRC